MEKLDFSTISTKQLKRAIKNYKPTASCIGITCFICPFQNRDCTSNIPNTHKQFKEELNRREKDMNEMPELKAGMIVEIKTGDLLLCLPYGIDNEGLMFVFNDGRDKSFPKDNIDKIYHKMHCGNYFEFLDNGKFFEGDRSNFKLIWSKKSGKDIKQQEILKQIDDLKQEHSKFMDNAEKISNDIDELKTKMETLN